MEPLAYRKMDFEEFCAATISTHQLEAHDRWEDIASTAFEHFEREGNRLISVEELARVIVIFFIKIFLIHNQFYYTYNLICTCYYAYLCFFNIIFFFMASGVESWAFSLFSSQRLDKKY